MSWLGRLFVPAWKRVQQRHEEELRGLHAREKARLLAAQLKKSYTPQKSTVRIGERGPEVVAARTLDDPPYYARLPNLAVNSGSPMYYGTPSSSYHGPGAPRYNAFALADYNDKLSRQVRLENADGTPRRDITERDMR